MALNGIFGDRAIGRVNAHGKPFEAGHGGNGLSGIWVLHCGEKTPIKTQGQICPATKTGILQAKTRKK